MKLTHLKQFIEAIEKEYGPMILDLDVTLMQETEEVQIGSNLQDCAVSVGKDGPSYIVLIGNEVD